MFVFDNVLTAGTVLIRDRIESQNWTPSGFTAGWAIEADGDAFFNDATIRGVFIVGDYPGGEYLIIGDDPNNPAIEFQTTGPGGVLAKSKIAATGVFLNFDSGDFGFGKTNFNIYAPNGATVGGGFEFVGDPSLPATYSQVVSGAGVAWKLGLGGNTNQVALNSLNHLFQLGAANAPNMAAGNFGLGYCIQGRDNGALLADFYVNPLGTGRLQLSAAGATTFVRGALDVASTLNVIGSTFGAAAQFSGNVDANSVTAGSCTLSGGVISNSGGTAIGTNVIAASGIRGTFATAGAANVNTNAISGKDQLRIATSSRRYKRDIEALTGFTADDILALNPRQYRRIDEIGPHGESLTGDDVPLQAGFIAEEADELGLTPWVIHKNQFDFTELDEDGNPKFTGTIIDGFSYGGFAAVGHQIVLREQAAKIKDLEARLERLERLLSGETSSLPSNT